jgi:hypothetical protein
VFVDFALPLIGHWLPNEWFTELLGWGTFVGIVVLIAVRQKNHPRFAASDGRRSRFYGSTFWQAYYVEGTILIVGACILTLRGLEYALAGAQGEQPGALHFPLTAWLGMLFDGASVGSLKTAIVLTATLKIVVSMAWFITIATQPTMGVAWHRFLAFFTIWFKRHPGRSQRAGDRSGPLQPIRVRADARLQTVEELGGRGARRGEG